MTYFGMAYLDLLPMQMSFFKKKYFIYLFLGRGERGAEREGEKHRCERETST